MGLKRIVARDSPDVVVVVEVVAVQILVQQQHLPQERPRRARKSFSLFLASGFLCL